MRRIISFVGIVIGRPSYSAIKTVCERRQKRFTCALSCLPAFLFVTVVFVGCNKSMDGTIKGRVTYNGQPLEGAILQFGYVGEGSSAQAITVDDGEFQVRTGSHLGAKVGEYTVSVSPAQQGSIPAKYSNPKTSGLTLEVKAGKNTYDISLTDE